jgi:hypothetical protein
MPDDATTADLGRLLLDRVAEVEPSAAAENALFPVLAAAYFRDPARALAGAASGGSLAFGLGEAAILFSPLLLEAARRIAEYAAEEAAKRGVAWSGERLRRLFGRGDEAKPELTGDQWNHVHGLVVEVLTGPGKIPPGKAELLADAIVGRGRRGDD